MTTESTTARKVVLVMLSTGKQGGAVVRALAKANESAPADATPWLILAQTRDPSSAQSKALRSLRGVPPAHGYPSRRASTKSYDNPRGVDGEMAEARALADVAAKHGVQHFVYASVNFGGAPDTAVAHFESKRLGEEYLKTKHPKLPVTVLRPVTFMDELVAEDPKSATARLVKIIFLTQLKPTARLQLIACSDIGGVAALVLQNPERYVGQVVDLAGDQLGPKDMEDGWREVFGEEMRPQMLGGTALAWAIRNGRKELRSMFKFWNAIGFNADIPALREQYPELKDWRTFLKTEVASQ
ncbi:hypothetical protein DFH09DRAFT_1292679 [Mycena vulgaris]|nr:hypothetical protein DFH09DRAFT_1292679 [Mycena vulgaris]